MSAPFVIQAEGAGGLAKSLAPLMRALEARQQLNLQYAKLQQDQEEFELRSKLMGTQQEGMELENEKKKRELQAKQDTIAAQQEALRLVTGNLSASSDDASWGEVFASIKDPETADWALKYHTDFANSEKVDIERHRAETDLRRAGVDLGAAQSQADITKNQLRVSNEGLGADLRQARTGNSPARVGGWFETWKSGVFNAGETARLWGVSLEGSGINPAAMAPPDLVAGRGGKGSLNDAQRKARTFYEVMSTTGPIIDQLVADPAVGGLTLRGGWVRSLGGEGLWSTSIAAALNTGLDPNQQKLIQAHQMFSDSWRYFVSGQQTSDKEGGKILKYAAESVGDSDEVKKQKKEMRTMMIRVVKDASGEGATGPANAIQQMILTASAMGWDRDRISYLQSQLADAQKYEAEQKGGKIVVDNTPTDTTQILDRSDRAKLLIRKALGR